MDRAAHLRAVFEILLTEAFAASRPPVRSSLTFKHFAILNDLAIGGGAERVLAHLVTEVFAEDDPLVLLYQRPDTLPFKARTEALDVPLPPYGGMRAEAWALLAAWWKLSRIKRREGLKLVLSHKEGSNLINVLSGATRTVITVHEVKSSGMKYRGAKRALTKALIRLLYNRADRVIAVSRGISSDLIENFGVRAELVRVITNPCDVQGINALAREAPPTGFERDPARPTLISVGRLATEKGQWHLLRAFAKVREQLPTARLVIAGVGDHRELLDRMCDELAMTSAVQFAGFQKNPFSLMAAADVLVMSSLWEGFPLVLAEAMSCGLPVVSTDCPVGAREILAPQTRAPRTPIDDIEQAEFGLLTPPLDGIYHQSRAPLTRAEAVLANAVVTLLTDQPLRARYIAQGARRVEDFSLEGFRSAWRDALEVGLSA